MCALAHLYFLLSGLGGERVGVVARPTISRNFSAVTNRALSYPVQARSESSAADDSISILSCTTVVHDTHLELTTAVRYQY